jgi:hypothetical protein
MKVDPSFKQLIRATLSADAAKTKSGSQDSSLVPIDTLRTKLGERAIYDPAVLRLPAFFGTGGISSDQLRLRPPEKSSSTPHEIAQSVARVRGTLEAGGDQRFEKLTSVLRTLEGFQRNLRPRMRSYEG